MKREKELALTLAVRLVEQDKTITCSSKMANASVKVAKILEQYLKEDTSECYKNPYEQVFMGGDTTGDVPKDFTYTTCKACGD